MAKDYAKNYTKYKYLAPKRKNNRYLWIMLGISIGLLILGLFLLKPIYKEKPIRPDEKKINKKLETPEPQPPVPEPKFDFYNILPQDNLSLSPHANSAIKEIALPNAMTTSDAMLSLTPEQVAIAEAKKQLEAEMGQFKNEVYVLVLGNFTDRARAEQLQAQALLKGFPVQKKVSVINGKIIYQIFMGPSDLNKLTQDKKRLNEAGVAAVLIKTTP